MFEQVGDEQLGMNDIIEANLASANRIRADDSN